MTEKPPKPHSDSRFKQQKLPSLYVHHSPQTLVISLLLVAIVFIPIGIAIVVSSDSIYELDLRYDTLNKYTYSTNAGGYQFPFNAGNVSQGTNTRVNFTLPKTIAAPVNVYYRVVGFHQNYRSYANSVDYAQLEGGTAAPIPDCTPFRFAGEVDGTSQHTVTYNGNPVPYSGIPYSPCGAIAWSLFNDTFGIYKVPDATSFPSGATVVCVGNEFDAAGNSQNANNVCYKSGIALSADVDTRFKPSGVAQSWTSTGHGSTSDPFLTQGYYVNEPGHRVPVATDEDFMVWARISSMPDFRKLYRVITVDMVAGDYVVDIGEFFDVVSFSGEKHIVIATTAWIGGKNYVLGIALIVMGCVSFVIGVSVVIMCICRKKAF